MTGCQAVKQNGEHCRNWSMKGKTCCYVHRYLEDLPAEVEEVAVKKNTVKKTKECSSCFSLRYFSEDGTVYEVPYMKNLYTPLPLPPHSSEWSSDSDHEDESEDESEPEDGSEDDPDYK